MPSSPAGDPDEGIGIPARADQADLARLQADGWLEVEDGEPRPTRRWRAAMMRATAELISTPDAPLDLRVPVALVLVAAYGDTVENAVLCRLVIAMANVEARALGLAPTS